MGRVITIIPFILHLNPQCHTSTVEHNTDPIQHPQTQGIHSDVSIILTCACSTCTPDYGHNPARLLQAAEQTQAKISNQSTHCNLQTTATGTAHPHAKTHRVAAVDEVVALRREAAQHAVLLLRWRGPTHPPPQPAAA
jgi:hypothetical protein